MEIHIFGRTFYFLANNSQYEKLLSYLKSYWTGNAISMTALVLMIAIIVCAFAVIPVKGRTKQIINRVLVLADAVALYMVLVISRESGTRELRKLALSNYLAGPDGFHESEILMACLYIALFFPFGMLMRRACEATSDSVSKSAYYSASKSASDSVSKSAPDSASHQAISREHLLAFVRTLLWTLAFGILIETSQYVFAKGVTYAGHVLAYMIGAMIGALIMGLGLRMSEKKK